MLRYYAFEVNGPGLAKKLSSSKHSGKPDSEVRFLRERCGWRARFPDSGSVGVVQATTWSEAADKLWALQIKQGILEES